MRFAGVILAGTLALASPAAAETIHASGSLGAGMFGSHPSTTLGVGVDVAGKDYAAGLGARLQLLAGEGVRTEAWDEASEVASILRYAIAEHTFATEATVSAALGELGGVSLGHGTVVGGYAAGLNLDHGHLGAEAHIATTKVGVEALIDDVLAPRIFGAETNIAVNDTTRAFAETAFDIAAPSMTGSAVVAALGAGAEISQQAFENHARGTAYAEAIGLFGLGAGLHAGAVGTTQIGDSERSFIGARGEVFAGTPGYIGRYFGPLYERDRRRITAADGTRIGSQLDAARAEAAGGIGGYGAVFADIAGLGRAKLAYHARPGLADQLFAELSAPYFRETQLAVWAAADIHEAGLSGLMIALEARARIAERLFVSAETARLLCDDGMGVRGIWLASVAVGAIVGE